MYRFIPCNTLNHCNVKRESDIGGNYKVKQLKIERKIHNQNFIFEYEFKNNLNRAIDFLSFILAQ